MSLTGSRGQVVTDATAVLIKGISVYKLWSLFSIFGPLTSKSYLSALYLFVDRSVVLLL